MQPDGITDIKYITCKILCKKNVTFAVLVIRVKALF